MKSVAEALRRIREVAGAIEQAGGCLSGEAAAHVHLAAATGMDPGGEPRYLALPPLRVEAVFRDRDDPAVPGVVADAGAVAGAVRERLDLFSTSLTIGEGPAVRVLTREATIAVLLARGGLGLGLVGLLVRLCRADPIDPDDVRDILKAARMADCYAALPALLDAA